MNSMPQCGLNKSLCPHLRSLTWADLVMDENSHAIPLELMNLIKVILIKKVQING